jgi:aromatic-L-amino-acid/L-tryptophan decarboxylase
MCLVLITDSKVNHMLSERYSLASMDKEEFKKIGYQLIDTLAHFIDNIHTRPVTTGETPDQILSILGQASLPENGTDAETIINRAAGLLLNHSLLNGHPKFLGYITSSAMPIGALADLLSASVNSNVGANILSPMATAIEKQTIQWLTEFIGLSPGYSGIMVSGGNMANMTAFLAARTAKGPKSIKEEGFITGTTRLLVYCSRGTHTWIEKAASFFGVGSKGIRWIEQDDSNKIRVDLLEQTIMNDLQAGHTPMMVIGNAGDVSTGAVDNLKAISAICKTYQIWFHIDGAYGMPAAVLPSLSSTFEGISEADSIAMDPHKWLYSPLEAGCTLVKDPSTLLNTFSTHPAYYNFNTPEMQAHNFHEYGFQNSRGFRALKVWLALQQVGRQGYIKMIGDDVEFSQLFFQLADNHPELEAITQNLSITTLRYVPIHGLDAIKNKNTYLNKLNETLLNRLQQEGKVFLSNAIVKDKYCLRGCIVNFRTTRKDIEEIIQLIVAKGKIVHKDLISHFNFA